MYNRVSLIKKKQAETAVLDIDNKYNLHHHIQRLKLQFGWLPMKLSLINYVNLSFN